ncbi:MAG: hypothetical protein KF873_03055 [Gemmataceae bacterium]|nr:hypothetical protein [Gemmataceae bacterium]
MSALGKPTEWPADAIERAKKFDGEFPQFSDLLTPIPSPDDEEEAAVKSPVLEQFAEDLHRSEKYQIWVQRKLWYRLKSLKGLPNRDALAEVLIGRAGYAVYRFLIGKSAQWAILATAEKSWLDVGLDFARSIPKRMDNDENYGQQNGPGPQDPSGPSPVSAFAGLESETPGPLDDLLDEETRKRLRDCIDKLPEDQRELIEWLLEGQSLTDFAKATGKTISAVIRIRDKAYVNLKKCLDRNQGQ